MAVNVAKIRGNGLYLLTHEEEEQKKQSPYPEFLGARFRGEGARVLNIDGFPVTRQMFERLNNGWSPDGKVKLTRNAGSKTRCRGWTISIAPDKSVSDLLMVFRPEEWKPVIGCHQVAARAAIRCLEQFCGLSRRGAQGRIDERAGLVMSEHTHLTSRNLDPQIHTHVHVFNIAWRTSNRTFGTVKSANIYRLARAIDAVYQKTLSLALRERLGIVTTRNRFAAVVRGVPETVKQATSTRSAEIEAKAGPRDTRTPKEGERAARATQAEKTHPTAAELFSAWSALANRLSFTRSHVVSRPPKPLWPAAADRLVDRAIQVAAQELASEVATFTRWDLLARAMVSTIGKAVSHEAVVDRVRGALEEPRRSGLVRLGKENGAERLYTTEKHLLLESRLVRTLDLLAQDTRPIVRAGRVDRILAENLRHGDGRILSDEQRRAVRTLTAPGRLAVLTGYAGTGKTRALAAVRAILAPPWYDRRTVKPNRVIGCAVSGIAADTLERETGIQSVTLAKLLKDLRPTSWRDVCRAVRRTTFGSPANLLSYAHEARKPRLKLDRRTTVILDEASLANTRDLYSLSRIIHRTGARLVLVGDAAQMQAIGPAGALNLVLTRYPDRVAKLETIRRQHAAWEREAVKAVATGEARQALKAYRENGRLTVTEDRVTAREAAVKLFAENGGLKDPRSHLMLANTNEEVRHLNLLAQEVRRSAGELSGRSVRVRGLTPDGFARVYAGDRVQFRRNHTFPEGRPLPVAERLLKTLVDPIRRKVAERLPDWLRVFVEPQGAIRVRNGQFGVVIAAAPAFNRLIIQLDTGERAVVNLKTYQALSLGYATSVFKAQSTSVPHAYALMGRLTNRESAYVALSRGQVSTHLIVPQNGLGPDFGVEAPSREPAEDGLARQMERSRQKSMAIAESGTQTGSGAGQSAPPAQAPEREMEHDLGP